MTKPYDLKGQKFGRLTVLRRVNNDKHGSAMWEVQCQCKNISKVTSTKLILGKTKSCGCLTIDICIKRNTKHGHASRVGKSREYRAWLDMKKRCLNSTNKSYKSYGAVGISIYPAWIDNFDEFFEYIGRCPPKYELDRIDSSKGYCPDNIRWVSETTQSRNRPYCKLSIDKARDIKQSKLSVKELADMYGVGKSTIERVLNNVTWKEDVVPPFGSVIRLEE